jgi:hypothetical protein
MENRGIEPPTYRMRSGRSTPELIPQLAASMERFNNMYMDSIQRWPNLLSLKMIRNEIESKQQSIDNEVDTKR